MIGKQPLIVPNKSFLALIGQRGGADRLSLLDWANLTLEERVNYETIERYLNGLSVPTSGPWEFGPGGPSSTSAQIIGDGSLASGNDSVAQGSGSVATGAGDFCVDGGTTDAGSVGGNFNHDSLMEGPTNNSVALANSSLISTGGTTITNCVALATGSIDVASSGGSMQGTESTCGGSVTGRVNVAFACQGTISTNIAHGASAVGVFAVAYSDGQQARASRPAQPPGAHNTAVAQWSRVTGCLVTTDGAAHQLRNGATAGLIIFPDYTRTLIVRGRVVGRRTDTPGTDSGWSFQGVVRGDGVGTYSWVGGSAPAPVVIAQDAAAAGWVVVLAVSGTSLTVTVTGTAAETIAWEVTLELDEVA